MAYDDTELESIFENDDEGGEGWDREWSEAFPRYRSAYKKTGRTAINAPKPHRPTAGVRGGTVQTPGGGRAAVTLPTAVTPKDAFDTAIKELKADIARQAEAIRKVDQTLDTNTTMLDKKITLVTTDLKKSQQNSQFSSMLPLLLSRPPEIKSLTSKLPNGTTGTVEIEKTEYKAGDSSALLMMMAMGGGFGGSGSGDNSNMLMMALAFGAFK
jgi:hypothetical protein